MATISQCPSCGESEHLRGRPLGDDIEVSCETCSARWLRGAPRCNACECADVVTRPQVMTRHPRGNQLAIVGRRELPLCPDCDAEAIADSLTHNRPVPETYVSVFLFGRESPGPAPRPPAPVEEAPAGAEPATRKDLTPARLPGSAPTPRKPVEPTAQPAVRPTVRQAIEAYLAAEPGADSAAMLLLGQHLGPASRLDVLDRAGAAESLARWFDATWTERQPARRRAAAEAITGAVDHWRTAMWLTEDAAVHLR